MATSLIAPLEMASGSALTTGPLAASGDVRHFSKNDGISPASLSNPTRQLANRDNLIVEKVNEIVASVNNREQVMPLDIGCTSLPAGASDTVGNFRIPAGFEARVLDAIVTSSPANGARIEVLFSANTYGASSGTQVILTADEFTGGSDFWPTGEFIIRIYNEGPTSSTVTGCLILTMRPTGPQSGGLIGPGAVGPQGAVGPTGLQGAQGAAGRTGLTGLGLTFRGVWSNTVNYALNDVVSYVVNGAYSTFIAVAPSVAQQPPTNGTATAYWSVAASGTQGAQGNQGPQGNQGTAGGQGGPGFQGAQGGSGTSVNERINSVNLATGSDTVGVTFNPVFASMPQIPQCTVAKPNAQADNIFVVSVYGLSTTGFTAQLSDAPAVGGYQMGFRCPGASM